MLKRLYCVVLLANAAALVASTGAGNLDPPGTPLSSMVTLDDIATTQGEIVSARNTATPIDSLPFVIDEPGSYRVTQNLTGVPASDGILILADSVTLDLGGFTLTGVPGSLAGVVVSPEDLGSVFQVRRGIAIHGGHLENWDEGGINALFSLGTVIHDVYARRNGTVGIAGGLGSIIQRSTVSDNALGMVAFLGGRITQCTSVSNETIGIAAGIDTQVSDCAAIGNRLVGISAADDVTVTNCVANNNVGLLGGGTGINCSNRVTVRDCTANENGDDGISVDDKCVVVGNTCNDNDEDSDGTGAGIHVGGEGNRIEGNSCGENALGVDVPGTDNLVVRNWARDNTGTGMPTANFNVSGAANQVGPIVGSLGVISSTNPWANFEL